MQSFSFIDVIYYFIYYLPGYVGLVLVPAIIRALVERAFGIRSELGVSIEGKFTSFVLYVFYYPFFEEVFFRGVPLLLFGLPGLVIGSIVWALLHPVWQVQLVSYLPVSKRILFIITSTFYYLCAAVFYTLVWLGSGLVAFLYHSLHNGIIVLGEFLREIEPPWRRIKFRPSFEFKRREEVFERNVFVKQKNTLSSLRDESSIYEYVFVKKK